MELVRQQASSKRRLKLGDIAELLQIKKFVIRSWEKELNLAPQSGLYGAEAIEIFKKIKQLVQVEKQSLDHVRNVIGASKSVAVEIEPAAQDCVAVAESMPFVEAACEVVVSYEAASSAGEPVVEALELKTEEFDTVAADEEVASAVFLQGDEIDNQDVVALALGADAEIDQSGHRYEAATEVSAFVGVSLVDDSSQQKFLAELAFFKQELLKFQQLLNV
jgi:hypothetical protein